MTIVTLLSDFGSSDYHVAMVKAELLKRHNSVNIVDISHDVKPFNILEASFILLNTYPYFPEGSIHLIGVDAEAHEYQKHLLIKQNNHYFIGADNGIFSLLDDAPKQEIIEIIHDKSLKTMSPMRDVFPDIVDKLLNNKSLKSIGKSMDKVNTWKRLMPDMSVLSEITGHIIYIDRFGNLITDVSEKVFREKAQERSFTIYMSSEKIKVIHQKYSDMLPKDPDGKGLAINAGKAMAVFNSIGHLEIALYRSDPKFGGSAASLLGMKIGDSFKIIFE